VQGLGTVVRNISHVHLKMYKAVVGPHPAKQSQNPTFDRQRPAPVQMVASTSFPPVGHGAYGIGQSASQVPARPPTTLRSPTWQIHHKHMRSCFLTLVRARQSLTDRVDSRSRSCICLFRSVESLNRLRPKAKWCKIRTDTMSCVSSAVPQCVAVALPVGN
jgi:hypothetical protein